MQTSSTKPKRKPRTGTLLAAGTWEDGTPRWRGRLTLADGTKSERFDVPHGLDEKGARAFVASWQALEDAQGGMLAKRRDREREKAREAGVACEGETADAWYERYLETVECADGHRRILGSYWRKWIRPVLGHKPMRDLTRDLVEDVRDRLDRAIDAKQIRAATARNVWSALTSALKAAYGSRDRSLRLHPAPLHFGLLPPKRGEARQRPWLYPREWRTLATCAAVPIERRQTYAIALYTGLRPGELRALTWDDVDLEARTLSVSKAWDEENKTTKPPKTAAGQRTVPIEPALLPLLAALRGEGDDAAKGTAPVAPLLAQRGEDHMAPTFRADLRTAGLNRPRLFADNATEESVDFRSLRDSYATWLALADVSDKRIQRRLGHSVASTTDRYIKAAEAFDVAAIGEPFPPLPEALQTSLRTTKKKRPGKNRGGVVARVGFEAITGACEDGASQAYEHETPPKAPDTPPMPPSGEPSGPASGPALDGLDRALAAALELAVSRGDLELVARLVEELRARRLAAAVNVVDLDTARKAGR